MEWKKSMIVFFTGIIVSVMTACSTGKKDDSRKEELIVFAAASMTESLNEIAELYKRVSPNVEIIFNFDSSGTLKTQIQEGAECDVFISAAKKQMDELKDTDMLLDGSPVDLLENKVVLAVTEKNPAGIRSFEDLGTDRLELIGLGNEDVPVGAYSEKILNHFGIRNLLNQNGKISYGSNVKEVTTQIAEGSVDCGIIYATDALAAGLVAAEEATEEMCGKILYPAAVMKHSGKPKEAMRFLEYLKSEEGVAVFEAAGFTITEK